MKFLIPIVFFSLPLFGQNNQKNSDVKAVFGMNTFYQYYSIKNLNLNDSTIGRTNIVLCNVQAQFRLYKFIYAGFKAHYNISNSYFFTSTSNNFKRNYKVGPTVGTFLFNKKGSFYVSPEAGFLFSNFELQDNIDNSNVIIQKPNFKLGIDVQSGFKLRDGLFFTAGLSLNNFFKVNYEFNYFTVGLSCIFFNDVSKTNKSDNR